MEGRQLALSNRLWAWFLANADAVASQLEQRSDDELPPALAELDSLVAAFGQNISWEIGPLGDRLFLAISPGGDAEQFQLTKEIVALAEPPEGWVLLPAKPAKEWNRSLQFAGLDVDANRWLFRIRRWDDGGLGVIWGIPSDYGLPEADQNLLGWLVLESEIGEATAIERVVDVEVNLLSDWPDDAKGRPIHMLGTDLQQQAGAP